MDIINDISKTPEKYTVTSIRSKLENDPWLQNLAVNTWEFLTQQSKVTSYPPDIVLPMTESCNAKCKFCIYCRYSNFFLQPKELSKFSTLIRYAKNFGFSAYGEPLLHPNFTEYCQTVKSYLDPRATTYLVTNGILLREKIAPVIKFCDSISVSLNAATPKTHAEIMGVKPKHFTEITATLKEIVAEKKITKPNLLVQSSFVVTNLNVHEVPDYITLVNEIGIDRAYLLNLSEVDNTSKANINNYKKMMSLLPSSTPDIERISKLVNRMVKESDTEIIAEPNNWAKNQSNTSHKQNKTCQKFKCSYLYQRLLLTDKELTLKPCCYLDAPPNHQPISYQQDRFLSGWNNEGMQYLRKSISNQAPPKICKRCIDFNNNIFNDNN